MLGRLASRLGPQRRRVQRWYRANGDQTLRRIYDLTAESIVFDVGGFEGNWASDIFAMYCCTVHVFEPVPAFADAICTRFARNAHIQVWPFGLGAADGTLPISMAGDRSSLYQGDGAVPVPLRSFAGFVAEQGITHIDLLKINIEGGEYDLLTHILDEGLETRITDIQVQFHSFVPGASRRMAALQRRLEKTHRLTYQYRFVWENWRLHS